MKGRKPCSEGAQGRGASKWQVLWVSFLPQTPVLELKKSAIGEMPSGCSQRKSKPSTALSRQRTWKGAVLQYRNFWLITFLSPGTLWSHPHVCTPTKSLLSCPTLCDPMDCSPPGSSVHGDSPGKNTGVGCHALLQGIFPTQGSNRVPYISCIGRWILYHLSHQVSLPAQQQRLSGEWRAPPLSAGHGDDPPTPEQSGVRGGQIGS